MTPVISVLLAIGTSLFALAFAVAKHDVLKNAPGWLLPLLIVAGCGFYAWAGILAIFNWRREQRKEQEKITHPSTSPISIHLENIGNPTQSNIQATRLPVRSQPKPEPEPNIHFVEIEESEVSSIKPRKLYGIPLCDAKLFNPILICFRNEPIKGVIPKQPQVDAHIVYEAADRKEVDSLNHGVWVGESKDCTTFATGDKKCLIVLGLNTKTGKLCKLQREKYHTGTSWSGPLFEAVDSEIPEPIESIAVKLLDHWNGACIEEFRFRVSDRLPDKLPKLELD